MSAEIDVQADSSSFLIPHTYPGRLVAAEGLDGSGKSTQLQLLRYWLQAEGYEVHTAANGRDARLGSSFHSVVNTVNRLNAARMPGASGASTPPAIITS